jgi:hypothetical protein
MKLRMGRSSEDSFFQEVALKEKVPRKAVFRMRRKGARHLDPLGCGVSRDGEEAWHLQTPMLEATIDIPILEGWP